MSNSTPFKKVTPKQIKLIRFLVNPDKHICKPEIRYLVNKWLRDYIDPYTEYCPEPIWRGKLIIEAIKKDDVEAVRKQVEWEEQHPVEDE